MSTSSIRVIRGSAARAVRVVGGLSVAVAVLLGSAMWLFVRDATEKKIAGEIALLTVVPVIVFAAAVAAACTVARVQDATLEFFFCGVRTRSFALDAGTTFDLHRIGRLEVLRIRRGRSTYVPNGALDRAALVELLRANGVAERRAD